MRSFRIAGAATLSVLALGALSGCAGTAGASAGVSTPVPVVATGTVLDDGASVRLCVSILESYPPQCGEGVGLSGWSWDGVDGAEEASGVRWGGYAVPGDFDGETLFVAGEPTMLALYDTLPWEPSDDPVQQELDDRFGDGVFRVQQ
jgi:hypothetical protein